MVFIFGIFLAFLYLEKWLEINRVNRSRYLAFLDTTLLPLMGMEPTHSVQSLDRLIVPPEPLHTTSALPDRITGGPGVGNRSKTQFSRETRFNGKI